MSPIFPLNFFPSEVVFQVYLALQWLLDEIVFLHALATQEDDGLLATVHSFVNSERLAFDARFWERAPEVTGRTRPGQTTAHRLSTSTPTLGR